MGNYVFDTEVLIDVVTADAQDESSSQDIGRDIIPRLVREGVAKVWDFSEGHVPGMTEREIGYWRDIGTLDAYYDAHMDLISTEPVFNLYNARWPILKRHERLLPPAKFVHQEHGRIGMALDSMVCSGVVVSGGVVRRSILSPGVRVHSRAEVEGPCSCTGSTSATTRSSVTRSSTRAHESRREPALGSIRRPIASDFTYPRAGSS